MVERVISIIKILLLSLLIVNILGSNNICLATSIDVTENPDYWSGLTEEDEATRTVFNQKIKDIVETIRIVGMVISIIALSIIGIKFMIGSVEERAQYKQTLVPWLIGAIMIFAISALPSIIFESSNNMFS